MAARPSTAPSFSLSPSPSNQHVLSSSQQQHPCQQQCYTTPAPVSNGDIVQLRVAQITMIILFLLFKCKNNSTCY
jgi:hypothetical protein